MSPLQIEILMHYYTRATDYRGGDFAAPAVRESIDYFRRVGILVDSSDKLRTYEGSPGLGVYMDALCALPLPKLVWRMPTEQEAA